MSNEMIKELNRLNFEDILWCIFIVLSILNIVSNKKYIINGDEYYEDNANKISIFVLIILVFIYIFLREIIICIIIKMNLRMKIWLKLLEVYFLY